MMTAVPPLQTPGPSFEPTLKKLRIGVAFSLTALVALHRVDFSDLLMFPFFVLLCVFSLTLYMTHECTKPPLVNPHTYVTTHLPRKPAASRSTPNCCLVFIGDSITHQRLSGEFCRMVASDLGPSTTVVTCAQNSIASETVAKERVHHAVACRPDFVCVMIGTNDIKGVYNREWGAKTRRTFLLEHDVSYDRFEENLRSILATLLSQTAAQIAVCTLPFMGEDLDSAANQCVAHANELIKRIVIEEQLSSQENERSGGGEGGVGGGRLTLLDTHKDLCSVLLKSTTKEQRFSGLKVDDFNSVMLSVAFRSKVLRQSYDQIGARYGLSLLCDALHLNDKGAMVVAGTILTWLKIKKKS
jgi:hypothetical protein